MKPATTAKVKLLMLGIPLTRLASHAGVTLSYASRVVNGHQRASARIKKAVKELTGIDGDIFFGEEG